MLDSVDRYVNINEKGIFLIEAAHISILKIAFLAN